MFIFEALEKSLGASGLFALVKEHPAEMSGFPADEDVLGNGEMLHHVQFLMDDADAHLQRMLRVPRVELVVEIADFPGIPGENAYEDLHERRFPRAIFTDQRVDLSLFEVEIHLAQGVHTGEAFVDLPH